MARWKKISLIVLSVFSALIILASLLAYIYEEEIKQLVVSNINKNLKTPVEVKHISFSFIRKFPYATLRFKEVKAKGLLYNESKKNLLSAEEIFLLFNLLDIFKKEIVLKRIDLRNTAVNIYINAKGDDNYHVWKSNDRDTSSALDLDLRKVIMTDVRISFRDIGRQQDYELTTLSGELNAHFAASTYTLRTNADLFVYHLYADGVNYLADKKAIVDFDMLADDNKNQYEFKNAGIRIAELALKANGIVNTSNETVADLHIHAEKANVKELLSLIPQKYLSGMEGYKYSGSVYFDARIKGTWTKAASPLIDISFGTVNATLSPPNSNQKITALHFKGHYTNHKTLKNPVSFLSLTDINGKLESQSFNGSLQLENLSHPFINFNLNSNIDLESLSHFYLPDTLEKMEGTLMVNASFTGKPYDRSSYVSSGTIELRNVSFRLKKKNVEFSNFNGHFFLSGNQLTVKDFKGNAAGSDFQLNGKFNNVFSFLMLPDQSINCDADVVSRNLDLNELLEDKTKSVSDSSYKIQFSDKLNLRLKLNIGIITFRKFEAWQTKGTVALANKIFSATRLSFKAMNGAINMQGIINAVRNDSILISCTADVKTLDVNQLFYQCENFGQEIMTDKNLRGKVTASVQFASVWSKDLHCNADKIFSKADITIENGELNNFTPMLSLSRYIKGADLKNIKFETLHDVIEISRQHIIIPAMQIHSSAFELTASGTHNFDNIVDYHLAFLLSQITGRKVKQLNTEFGTIEEDGLGRSKLFVTMRGRVNDPHISFDRKATEEKIVTDIRNEKQNLKNILNKEFGWFKKDTAITHAPPKKKEELRIEKED